MTFLIYHQSARARGVGGRLGGMAESEAASSANTPSVFYILSSVLLPLVISHPGWRAGAAGLTRSSEWRRRRL
jgi:hypothetical protein